MKPRLNSSKKWTAFPAEYIEQIEGVFRQGFEQFLKSSKVIVQGRIYAGEILLQVGYIQPKSIKQNNFQISMSYKSSDDNVVELIHLGIDAVASIMQEFLEAEGEVDLPLQWREFEFNKKNVFIQYSTDNTELEAEADRLLGTDADGLVVEEATVEDMLENAEHMSPEELAEIKKKLH